MLDKKQVLADVIVTIIALALSFLVIAGSRNKLGCLLGNRCDLELEDSFCKLASILTAARAV